MKYRNISLKTGVVEEIEQKHVGPDKRYRSIAEFVTEAARLRLEELERRARAR